MKRRKFILLTGFGVSVIALPTWYYILNIPEYDPVLVEPEWLSHIWDSPTISKIGETYRKKFPDENSENKLVEFLSEHIAIETNTTTFELLRKQIEEDFIKGNTVMVDGWILSRTEARQCALFSLSQTN